jgi:ribosomal protein L10
VAIGLEDKKAIVAEVNETATSALSLVIADARGVSVDGMTALRKEARENQVTLRVVRNTLAKRALSRYGLRVRQRSARRSVPVRIFHGGSGCRSTTLQGLRERQ